MNQASIILCWQFQVLCLMLLHHCSASALLTHFCYSLNCWLLNSFSFYLNVCKNQQRCLESIVRRMSQSQGNNLVCPRQLPVIISVLICLSIFISLSITVILVLQSSTKRSDHYVGAVVEFAPTGVFESPQEVSREKKKWIHQSTKSKLLGSHFQHWQVPRLYEEGCRGGGGHHRVPGVRADGCVCGQSCEWQGDGQAVHGDWGGRQVRRSDCR